jgi:putative sigma-54 modulation protein
MNLANGARRRNLLNVLNVLNSPDERVDGFSRMSIRRRVVSVTQAAEHGRRLAEISPPHGEIREAWRALSCSKKMRKATRPRLQTSICDAIVWPSVMNDFPIQEDRPVEPTVNDVSAPSPSEATESQTRFFRSWKIAQRLKFRGQITASRIQFLSVNPITKVVMNRDNHSHDVIVSGIHLELTPSLKTFVQEKTARLFRHEERILRVRVELECDPKQAVATRFVAKGHVHINGPDMNASVASDECHKAVSLLTDKLDRMLQRRAQMYKNKRHRTHPLDLTSNLPKAI